MAFFGSFTHAIDDRGRVAIPSRFKEDLRGGVVTKGSDAFLVLYPKEFWDRMTQQREYSDLAPRDYHDYLLSLYANSQPVSWDSQGRILLTAQLRDYAGLQNDVVFVGMNNVVELYSQAAFDESAARVSGDVWERIRPTVARVISEGPLAPQAAPQ